MEQLVTFARTEARKSPGNQATRLTSPHLAPVGKTGAERGKHPGEMVETAAVTRERGAGESCGEEEAGAGTKTELGNESSRDEETGGRGGERSSAGGSGWD